MQPYTIFQNMGGKSNQKGPCSKNIEHICSISVYKLYKPLME